MNPKAVQYRRTPLTVEGHHFLVAGCLQRFEMKLVFLWQDLIPEALPTRRASHVSNAVQNAIDTLISAIFAKNRYFTVLNTI